MTLSISNDSKSAITITNEGKKPSDTTWDEATYTWDDAVGTWDIPGLVVVKESKNTITVTNESKN